MKKIVLAATMANLVGLIAACSDSSDDTQIPSVNDTQVNLDLSRGEYACYTVDTTLGDFTLALDEKLAPLTVANFDAYVTGGFYNDTIFHSAIKYFGIQGGTFTTDLTAKDKMDAVDSEQENGLVNYRGRIAMMRSYNDHDSATSEFIINVERNYHLDYPKIGDGGGLTVFGGVVAGMDVVDTISNVATEDKNNLTSLPVDDVLINGITASACPTAAEQIAEFPHPVMTNDDAAEIDLSRGDYACYQMVTSLGNIELAIDEKYAPASAANFQQYVQDEFYNGLLFHRVVQDFVIQGGGIEADYQAKDTREQIRAESRNGLKNYRGRLAMARTSAPHSATSQFYVNLKDNHDLNFDDAQGDWGYTVFGGVIAGMDVVDLIADVETGTVSGWQNTPKEQVTIDSVAAMSCPQ